MNITINGRTYTVRTERELLAFIDWYRTQTQAA